MPTLLKIDVSPRDGHSVSRALGAEFEQQWLAKNKDGKVVSRDLAKTNLPFVELPWILGAYSDPSTHNEEQKQALAIGNEMIAELKAADEWLITTPMYNFAVPAKLKAYIDHIIRVGQTFKVNSDGSYSGLVSGKKAYVILASAGEYGAGSPAETFNAETPYLKAILGFIGVSDVKFLQAGSTWKLDRGMEQKDAFMAQFADQVKALTA